MRGRRKMNTANFVEGNFQQQQQNPRQQLLQKAHQLKMGGLSHGQKRKLQRKSKARDKWSVRRHSLGLLPSGNALLLSSTVSASSSTDRVCCSREASLGSISVFDDSVLLNVCSWIVHFLDFPDLLALIETSKYFAAFFLDESIWQELFLSNLSNLHSTKKQLCMQISQNHPQMLQCHHRCRLSNQQGTHHHHHLQQQQPNSQHKSRQPLQIKGQLQQSEKGQRQPQANHPSQCQQHQAQQLQPQCENEQDSEPSHASDKNVRGIFDGEWKGSWRASYFAILRKQQHPQQQHKRDKKNQQKNVEDRKVPFLKGVFSDVLYQRWLCATTDVQQLLGCGDNLERVSASELPVEDFVARYEKPGKPVVITGLVEKWPASQLWSREFLIREFGDFPFAAGPATFSLRTFFSYASSNSDESPLSIFDCNFAETTAGSINSSFNTIIDSDTASTGAVSSAPSGHVPASAASPPTADSACSAAAATMNAAIAVLNTATAVTTDKTNVANNTTSAADAALRTAADSAGANTTAVETAALLSPGATHNLTFLQKEGVKIKAANMRIGKAHGCSLADDYIVPPYFSEKRDLFSDLSPRPAYRWLLIGGERSGSRWHIDPNGTGAWNAVVKGKKRWILLPPLTPPNGVFLSTNAAEIMQPLSLTEWYINHYEALHNQEDIVVYEGSVKAGELIYIPPGWWHCVMNEEADTIAVTQNYVSLSFLEQTRAFLLYRADQISGVDLERRQRFAAEFDAAVAKRHPELAAALQCPPIPPILCSQVTSAAAKADHAVVSPADRAATKVVMVEAEGTAAAEVDPINMTDSVDVAVAKKQRILSKSCKAHHVSNNQRVWSVHSNMPAANTTGGVQKPGMAEDHLAKCCESAIAISEETNLQRAGTECYFQKVCVSEAEKRLERHRITEYQKQQDQQSRPSIALPQGVNGQVKTHPETSFWSRLRAKQKTIYIRS